MNKNTIIFIDLDGVMNSQSGVRNTYIPRDDSQTGWQLWHKHFVDEVPNLKMIHAIKRLVGPSTVLVTLSNRSKELDDLTRDWLAEYDIIPDALMNRALFHTGDSGEWKVDTAQRFVEAYCLGKGCDQKDLTIMLFDDDPSVIATFHIKMDNVCAVLVPRYKG